MASQTLRAFADRISGTKRIEMEDVRRLQREILPDGIQSRAEADLLVSLDRMAEAKHEAWAEWLVAAAAEFAVWTSRPTGYVDLDTARWLTASLGMDGRPTETAAQIAFEAVRQAEHVDELLLVFVMRHASRRPLDTSEDCLAGAA
jgi:hypothetical protein